MKYSAQVAVKNAGLIAWGCSALFSTARAEDAAPSARRPNLLLIVTDDQGWADLGCWKEKTLPIETPNIDRLAREGVRFTDAYATCPVCSPSRAALLTMRYQQRFGYYDNWEAQVGLDAGQVLLPNRLKPLGYRTAAVGKWHLGWFRHNHPLAMGFDSYYGFTGGMHDYFTADEGETWEGGPPDRNFMEENGKRLPPDALTYMPDQLTDKAIDFIKQNTEQPFFIYLAYNTPHGPLQAPDSYLKRYANDNTVPDKNRKLMRAMLDALDYNIGRLLDSLESTGLADDTLIIYTSDNGGVAAKGVSDHGPLFGSKGHLSEGGIRTCALGRWPGHWPSGVDYSEPVIGIDFSASMLAAAGIQPSGIREVEGTDLTPFLQGQKTGRPHDTLHWQMHHTDMGRWAVREGDWKLVKSLNIEGLFNLREDIGETRDLRKQYPEIAERLYRKHMEWRALNQPSRVNDDTRRVHIWELRFRKDMNPGGRKNQQSSVAVQSPAAGGFQQIERWDMEKESAVHSGCPEGWEFAGPLPYQAVWATDIASGGTRSLKIDDHDSRSLGLWCTERTVLKGSPKQLELGFRLKAAEMTGKWKISISYYDVDVANNYSPLIYREDCLIETTENELLVRREAHDEKTSAQLESSVYPLSGADEHGFVRVTSRLPVPEKAKSYRISFMSGWEPEATGTVWLDDVNVSY